MPNGWFLGQSTSDPLQHLAEALVNFCFPNAPLLPNYRSNEGQAKERLKGVLTGDNVKAFLHEYRHFHSHWPIIHIPTFDPFTANHGLVLAICCVGAVYSDRLSPQEVRWLMEFVRACVMKSSQVYKLAQNPHQTMDLNHRLLTTTEELQALALLHLLLIWHGSQQQRQRGREELWALANVSRRAGLLEPLSRENPSASALHQPGPVTGDEVNSWNWATWVENEKRTRLTAIIFLIDCSSTLFFNTQPQFDVYEINVPLPADDAAWEAKSPEECASALGLRGQLGQVNNESGSRRAKQLCMSEALHVLYGAGHRFFPARATNVFGKFGKSIIYYDLRISLRLVLVLIHAIHMQIYNLQRQLLRRGPSSGMSTPQSQNGSPVSTPGSVNEQAQQLLRLTVSALELWKNCWDSDLALQFTGDQHRHGFCRDGVHYYFLAQIFLRKSRPEEWAAPADVRCQHVFNLMKQVRAHVTSDSAHKGVESGSVTNIADDFGIDDLTLNMKRLFTPLGEQ